jgi:Probable zinc-ribbon domain
MYPSESGRGAAMEYHDKVLKCADCGAEFVFTAGEQTFYADKGFKNEPKRPTDRDQDGLLAMRQRDNRPFQTHARASGILPGMLPAAQVDRD